MQSKKFRMICSIAAIIVLAIIASSDMRVTASAAANDITVYLDGHVLSFSDVQPQMIHDSVMVPLRAIGEAMGADVEWNPTTGVAELTLGDRFVRLTINSTVMDYGYFSGYAASRTEFDVTMYVLASPAIIMDGRTLVPLRAISEGFGGTAEWVGETRTVTLASPREAGTQPMPESDIFADTPWFVNISPARVQSMYDNDEKFVLIYYSGDHSSRIYIPLIKTAARESGVKTYGVDARLPDVGDLKWIRRYVEEADIVYPIVFRVFGKGSVGVTVEPRHQENLINLLSLFMRNLTDDPDAPWGFTGTTPSSNLEIDDTLDIRFHSIDLAAANRKLEDGERFIYVFYRSTAHNADYYLNRIKQAAIDADVDIYATDASQHHYPESQKWWGNPDGKIVYPTVFFISNRVVTSIEEQPDSRSRLEQLFRAHDE